MQQLKEEQERKAAEEARIKAEQQKVSHLMNGLLSSSSLFTVIFVTTFICKLKEEQERKAAEDARLKAEQEKVSLLYQLHIVRKYIA
jgi:membrane protein involved in colicin uptake